MRSTHNSIYSLFYKHKIVLIVVSFIAGILLNEYIGQAWILIGALGLAATVLSIIYRNLSFLLFMPLGLAFAANSQLIPENNILNFAGNKLDLEGVLYRSPESRESGTRLYIDTEEIIVEGNREQVSGNVIVYSGEYTASLAYGDRVRLLDITLRPIENYKNPGSFNLKKFYQRQNIYAEGFVDGEDSIISFGLSKSYSPLLHSIDEARIRFGNFVRQRFPSPQSEILNAITIGEKGAIPKEIRTEFSKAGVAHILAISGLHVGAVAIAFFFLIKWLLKRSEYLLLRFQVPRLAAVMTILPVFLYSAIAGFSTSTVRAFIMITLYLLSIAIGKEQYRVNTLSAAALIILLWHPWSFFEISFQLSFAAVLGILIAHKFYPFKFITLKDKFLSLLKTTVAAAFITFPIIANSFGILPLVSIPANLLLVPLVEFIIVPLSLISFTGYLIAPGIAELVISINIFFIDMLKFGVESVLRIPYSSLTIPPMNSASWAIFILLLISLLLASVFAKIKYVIPIIALGFVLSLLVRYPGISSEGLLEVSVLDAGSNKSLVFVKTPENKNIVIDGGYSVNDKNGYLERTVLSKYLLNEGVNAIDTLILITTDSDTLSGAVHLIDKFGVREILTNGDKLSGGLWEIINEKGIKWGNLNKEGDILYLGGAALYVLKTGPDYVVEDSSKAQPVAFKIEFWEDSFLLGSSLNRPAFQKELIERYGKNLASSAIYMPNIILQEPFIELMDLVSPKILVTGNNHNSASEIAQNLHDKGETVLILETDRDGAVSIRGEGKKLRVKIFNNEKELVFN